MSCWLLSRPIIAFVFFVERWLLSAVFLFLAYEHVATLSFMHLLAASRHVIPQAMLDRDAGFYDGIHFEDYARYGLLAASNGLCGVLLLISRRPSRYPTRAAEIVIPLVATFSYMGFNQRIPLPAWMTLPLVPADWNTSLAMAGVVFSALGSLFSLHAITWLGRSLGIVVSVREVVLGGPYRYVRHPIYLGYCFILTGLFLTACNVRMGVLVLGAFGLLVWRARLEEALLSAHSPAYRVWMHHTGFLWPKRGADVARVVAPLPEPASVAPPAPVRR